MNRRPRLTLGLALAGVLTFLFGVRRDDSTLRWAGIGALLAAFLLRFDRSPSGTDEG